MAYLVPHSHYRNDTLSIGMSGMRYVRYAYRRVPYEALSRSAGTARFFEVLKKFKTVNSRCTRGRISLYPGTRIYSFIFSEINRIIFLPPPRSNLIMKVMYVQ